MAKLIERKPRKRVKMPDSAPPDEEAYVTVKVTREAGVTKLVVNAKGLHDYLKALGAMTDKGVAINVPWSDGLNRVAHKVETGALVKSGGSTYTWDIDKVYGKPVNHTALQSIVDSVGPAVDEVVEFYRPVEMVMRVLARGK